ncbi:MAG TPA: lysozyme inhibitor LprI family protein [Acetobacteraceae bacterium]|nr:lysozyme inhibitor LprI family protein [Acetobacteraceae bacterium]
MRFALTLRLACALTLVLGGASCARGQSAHEQSAHEQSAGSGVALSAEYDRCLASATANADMYRCVDAERAQWDARLNAAYQAILAAAEFDARGKAELREAQRFWLTFRDKGCEAEGDLFAAGGTAAPLIAADCVLAQTARRAADLERIEKSGARAP